MAPRKSSSRQEVGLAIKRLQWRHHRAADRSLLAFGLSLPQWDVLRQLAEHPDASLHELAQLTFQSDQSMGAMAGRMIERGLLERVAGPGRAVRHRLTPEGERLRGAGAGVLDDAMADTIGQLSSKELTELHRLLLAAGGGA